MDYLKEPTKSLTNMVKKGIRSIDELPVCRRGDVARELEASNAEPKLPEVESTLPANAIEIVEGVRYKKQLEEFAMQWFEIDLDRRHTLAKLKQQVIELIGESNGGTQGKTS